MFITQYWITQYNADDVWLTSTSAVIRWRDFRDTKLSFSRSLKELTVDEETWEFRSHYVITMSRGSKGREAPWGHNNLCEWQSKRHKVGLPALCDPAITQKCNQCNSSAVTMQVRWRRRSPLSVLVQLLNSPPGWHQRILRGIFLSQSSNHLYCKSCKH